MTGLERSIKEKIENVGKPLKDWGVQINYGIKTGFNEAFIISTEQKEELVKKSPKCAEIIRPILLGKDIKRYRYSWDGLWLINSHNGIKEKDIPPVNLQEDYPVLFKFLSNFEEKLVNRQDQGDHWSNLRNCAYLEEFSKPKIAWGNLALKSQFTFIKGGYFINAPSPFFASDNFFLLAVLNSSIGEFYIKSLGVSRSGGYIEFKPMFVERMPIPNIHADQQKAIAEMVKKVLTAKEKGNNTDKLENEIDDCIFQLYGLTESEKSLIRTIQTLQ